MFVPTRQDADFSLAKFTMIDNVTTDIFVS